MKAVSEPMENKHQNVPGCTSEQFPREADFARHHGGKLLWDLDHDWREEGKFFSREEICIWRRRKVIINLDGYHSYRSKIRKENLEIIFLIYTLSVPFLAFATSSHCII